MTDDEHDWNRLLAERVHPTDWTPPTPAARYDLVVVGGGTAGLVSAAGAAGLGARVALVEEAMLGGDCLVTGCVPSKAWIASARAAAEARRAAALGVHVDGVRVDFAEVARRMRKERAEIARNDSAERFAGLGVDVFLDRGVFTGEDVLEVGGQALRFKRAIVATGAAPRRLDVPGSDDPRIRTNHELFEIVEQPDHLVVVGGGPIGCELGQTFARLGSKVTLLQAAERLLPAEVEDAGRIVERALVDDGVDVRTEARVTHFVPGDAALGVHAEGPNGAFAVDAHLVLLAVGRTPNVEGLGLEAAGVEFDATRGVRVDDHLRTTNRRVFAAGDVASRLRFTHAADFLARTALRNALFPGRASAEDLVIPWATFTDPEVARVGAAPSDVPEAETLRIDLADNDRSILDARTEGFVEIVHAANGRVLGATVVAPHAGESIGELVTAVRSGTKLSELADVIHPYPTVADAIRRAGDAFNRGRLTPWKARLLNGALRLLR